MSTLLQPVHIFIGGLERGGTQRNCVNIANMLSLNGHVVKITTIRKLTDRGYKSELSKKINVKALNHKSTRNSIISLITNVKDIDNKSVIFIMNYQLLPIIALLAKLFRKKNKIIVRNMNYISKSIASIESSVIRILQKYLLLITFPLIDIFIHQCKEMEEDFKSFCYFEPKKSIVINNVLSPSQKISNNKIEFEPYLLLVGKLLPQKNIKFAIDILKLFNKKYRKIDLIIIGEGKLLSNLKQYAKNINMSESVRFLGSKNNVDDYFNGAYATILTSYYEGFPNVLIESMRCNTPVVAHDCKSGPSELIINGENGFLVEYNNIKEFTKALKDIEKIDRSRVSSTIVNYLPENVYKQYSKIL